MQTPLLLGKYRHFKGGEYQVVGVARHSEEGEESMVVYRCLYGDSGLWVRPLSMFKETVEIDRAGIKERVQRFQLIAADSGQSAGSKGVVE